MSCRLHHLTILLLFSIALSGVFQVANAATPLEQTVVSAPLEFVAGYAAPFVRVKLDDGASYLLALDFGVPFSNLDVALARKSRLKVSREKLTGGEMVEVLRSGLRPAPLDGKLASALPPTRFVLVDLAGAREQVPELAGRLGADLLKTMAIRLDYGKKRIDFIPSGKLPGTALEPKGAKRIPLRMENDLMLVDGQVDGNAARFMLSCLDQTLLRAPKTLASLKPLYRLQHTEEASGALAPDSEVRLNEIRIGDAVWKHPVAVQMASDDPTIPDVLSLDLLRRFHVTIDAPSHSLYLEPDPESKETEVQRFGPGVLLRKTGDGHLLIASVSVPSPASEALLKVGDEIVAINGLAVASTPVEKIAAEADKPAGTAITLTVLRAGERTPREFKLTVRRLL